MSGPRTCADKNFFRHKFLWFFDCCVSCVAGVDNFGLVWCRCCLRNTWNHQLMETRAGGWRATVASSPFSARRQLLLCLINYFPRSCCSLHDCCPQLRSQCTHWQKRHDNYSSAEVRVTHSEQPAASCRGLAIVQAPNQLAQQLSTTSSRDRAHTAENTAAAPITISSVRARAAAAASASRRCRFSFHKLQRCPACSMPHKPSGAAIQLLSRPSCGKSSLQDKQQTQHVPGQRASKLCCRGATAYTLEHDSV
jgi:hypothetical protein